MTAASSNTWPPSPALVAILRGLQPERAVDIGRALFDAGFRTIEVPLNRPGALEAIALLAPLGKQGCHVGAGTVLEPSQVDAVAAAGGTVIVSPHFDAAVVGRARELGLLSVPGVFTASEAFAAWRAGANALKIFPAEAMTLAGLKGLTTVLPREIPLWPVGSITPENMSEWRAAGATGFGIGGSLFKPEYSVDEIATRAHAFVTAWHAG